MSRSIVGVRENQGARLRRRPLQLVGGGMSAELDKKARYQQSDSAPVSSPHNVHRPDWPAVGTSHRVVFLIIKRASSEKHPLVPQPAHAKTKDRIHATAKRN